MCKQKLNKEYIEKHQLKVPPKSEIGDKILNGDFYCEYRTGKSKSCLPIDDRIKCICQKGQVFDYKTQNCQPLDVCAFSYCSENEECHVDEESKRPVCKCKKNYHRNLYTDKCELDYCRPENDKPICNDMQDCINDLVNEKAVCECKNGFRQYGSDCVPLFANDEKSPFIKQYIGCTHTYELSSDNKEYKCACFAGYKLDQDKKTCIPEFDEKKCPKCSIKEVCIRPDPKLPNELKCICKLGYNGASKTPCEPHFCLDKSKSPLIRPTCPTIGNCTLLMNKRSDPIFACSCKTEINVANKKNGLCEIKQVCNLLEQNKCSEKNGLCIPKLINGSLVADCECSVGFGKDKNTDTCVPLDELLDCRKKFNAFSKYINVNKNKAICACTPGYEFDQLKKKCVLSTKDTIKLSTVVFLKRLSDELDRYEIPENLYIDKKNQLNKIKIFDCSTSKLLTKKHCYSEINSAFEPLTKLNKSLMMKNIEYQLYQKVRTLFYFISGDDNLSISMISFENVTEINENENGFNTKYLVEIAIISNDKNEGNKLQKNLNRMCSENEDDDKDDNELDRLKNFCYINKQMLPVSKELSLFGQLNLCHLPTKKINCPAYSSCKHEIKTDSNHDNKNRYTCVCDKGFKSLHKIEEYNLDIEICEDVDECKEEDKDGKKNECGANTECENLIGSYRCNCLENFKRSTDKICVPTCTESFPCVANQGKCKVFEKNYEICECFDGYKGIDCSKEDSLVILLKEILVFVSVGLGLMLIVTIGISVFCIKSVRKQKKKGDEQIYLDDLK